MTSKVLSPDLRKEYIRHHLAELLLVVFAALAHLLWFVIHLQNTMENYDGGSAAYRKKVLAGLLNGYRSGTVYGVMMGLAGGIVAIMAFRYLHSRQKIDFYHSLPIRRRDTYRLIVSTNLLMSLLPMLAGFLLETAICAASGYLTMAIWKSMLSAFFIGLISFAICFMFQALAMILTGHMAVGFLGGCVFAFYAPVLLDLMLSSYASTFFQTYSGRAEETILMKLSPFTLCLGLGEDKVAYYGINSIFLLVTLAWIAALYLLCSYLFKIRPSEMAGKAMAFPKMNTVLRFLLVVPMSLFSGMMLYQMTLEHSRIWLVAGIILSAALFHGVVEAIYQMDIRGLWSHRRQMVLTILVSLLIFVGFRLDITGYDRRMPKEGQLSSMIVEDSTLGRYTDYWGTEREGLKGEELTAAYQLVADIVGSKAYKGDRDGDLHTLDVTYVLKSGRKIKRSYVISEEAYTRELDVIYQMEEFKKDNLSLCSARTSAISEILFAMNGTDVPYDMEREGIGQKDFEDFLAVYREDLYTLSYADVCHTVPVGSLEVLHYIDEGDPEDPDNSAAAYARTAASSDYYYIYPSFSRTLNFLEERGYADKKEHDAAYRLLKLEITSYNSEGEEEVARTVSDEKLIEEVKGKLVPSELVPDALRSDFETGVDILAVYSSGGEVWNVGMLTDKETAQKLMGDLDKATH